MLCSFVSFVIFSLSQRLLVHFCCRFVARFEFILLLLLQKQTLLASLKAYRNISKQTGNYGKTQESIKGEGADSTP